VRIGDTTLDSIYEAFSITVAVSQIKQHPGYDSWTLENDISVLVLAQSVSLTQYPNIKPACLPAQGAQFPGQGLVSGWGTIESGGYQTAWLNEVDVTVFSDGDCGYMNQYMTDDMLCAGLKEGGKDACQGDSGGPLVAADPANNNWMTLIGVVSWGYGCAAEDALGIYSEVSHFTDWLYEQMPDLNTCPPLKSSTSPTPSGNSTQEECQENKIPELNTFKNKKKVATWDECRDICNDNPKCHYFKWKDGKKLKNKICFLLRVEWKPKENYVSGGKGCKKNGH